MFVWKTKVSHEMVPVLNCRANHHLNSNRVLYLSTLILEYPLETSQNADPDSANDANLPTNWALDCLLNLGASWYIQNHNGVSPKHIPGIFHD